MTPQEFSQKIKAKYPQYQNMNDTELAQKVVQKYPQYTNNVKFDSHDTSLYGKASDIAQKVVDVTGGRKVAEVYGSEIARRLVPEEQKKLIDYPKTKETVGSALALGSLFIPVGRMAGAISKGAKALGLVKGTETAGRIAAGGVTGAAADIGFSAQEDNTHVGLGTILGAGIPASSPILGAITNATGKLGRRAVFETSGILSGTSQETLEQAYQAAKQGGKSLDEFTTALRNEANPEKLVGDLQNSVNTVRSNQQTIYRSTLDELGDQIVSTQPAKNKFQETLDKFKITITDDGSLDFSKSELRTVPAAQSKITQAWGEISNMPEQLPIAELDTTRQAVKAIKSIAGDDPSANKANALIEDAVRSIRTAGEQVDGYGKMLDNFGETAQFLDELEKGLSTGDSKTIDQTYRRVITSLKTNNEQRMKILDELDKATNGAITSQIAGQQLSEFLPRGIIGRLIAPFIAGGAVAGGISGTMIPGLLMASPRVTGEFARALGLSTQKATEFSRAIDSSRQLLIKLGVLTGANIDNSSDNTQNK